MDIKPNGGPAPVEARAPFPRWKKWMIAGAAALVVIGLALKFIGADSRPEGPPSSGDALVAANPGAKTDGGPSPPASSKTTAGSLTLVDPGDGPDDDPEVPPGGGVRLGERPAVKGRDAPRGLSEKVSPFFLHGGLSFFVGLAIGALFRTFFKMVLLVAGVAVVAIFGLSYMGQIPPIDWAGVENWIVVKLDAVQETAGGLQDHLFLNLPSAGLAGAGLVAGFKRK